MLEMFDKPVRRRQEGDHEKKGRIIGQEDVGPKKMEKGGGPD